MKIVTSRSTEMSAWSITPGLGDLLEPGLTLDHDQGAVDLGGQDAGGVGAEIPVQVPDDVGERHRAIGIG